MAFAFLQGMNGSLPASPLPPQLSGKESACTVGAAGDTGSIPGLIRKIPWRRVWQPTPVFLPREFHGQRSLAGYSPQGHKDLDMTEANQHAHGMNEAALNVNLIWFRMYTLYFFPNFSPWIFSGLVYLYLHQRL